VNAPMSEVYAVVVPKGYRIGPYEVRAPIATGAFGSVYEARNTGAPGTPETVALKFHPTGTHTPRQLSHLRELAERELQLLQRLRTGPRLIRMYEALTVDDPGHPELDGATVLVLERAEGSLAALLARSPCPPQGPALLAQICEGLVQLHRAGWVHGDLKPANVLLMKDGSARLADFNMAAEMEGTHAYTPAFSTPDYTPPELLWSEIGERGRQIRPSADIWAFGVLAHLVLTGSFPLPGGSPTARRDAAVRYARRTEELRLSPELPDEWREIVTDCLARTHADRVGAEPLLRRVEKAAGATRSRQLPYLRRRLVMSVAGAAVAIGALGYTINAIANEEDEGGQPSKPSAGATVSSQKVEPADYGAAELRTGKGVPVRYRALIVDSAHDCVHPQISPALIAAMLKAESDFDANLADPAKDEFGIARWTPRVLRFYINADGTPTDANPKPPFTPAQSIPAMSRYLCAIVSRLESGMKEDQRLLIAAAYRTSYGKVNEARGVPAAVRAYADQVAHYLKEYTPPGKK